MATSTPPARERRDPALPSGKQARRRGHVVVDLAGDHDATLRVERDRLCTRVRYGAGGGIVATPPLPKAGSSEPSGSSLSTAARVRSSEPSSSVAPTRMRPCASTATPAPEEKRWGANDAEPPCPNDRSGPSAAALAGPKREQHERESRGSRHTARVQTAHALDLHRCKIARRDPAPIRSRRGCPPLALALPGAVEADHHGRPSFRVGGKIFATLWNAASST